MQVLNKLKGYQRKAHQLQAQITEQDQPGQQLQPGLQVGGTTQQGSPLQQKLQMMLKHPKEFGRALGMSEGEIADMPEHGMSGTLLKLVPGAGAFMHGLLYGDPYHTHTFCANAVHFFLTLMEGDDAYDVVELSRKQAYVEAEQRSTERNSASVVSSASGAQHDFGQDWKRQIDTTGHSAQALSESVPDGSGTDHRLETQV